MPYCYWSSHGIIELPTDQTQKLMLRVEHVDGINDEAEIIIKKVGGYKNGYEALREIVGEVKRSKVEQQMEDDMPMLVYLRDYAYKRLNDSRQKNKRLYFTIGFFLILAGIFYFFDGIYAIGIFVWGWGYFCGKYIGGAK